MPLDIDAIYKRVDEMVARSQALAADDRLAEAVERLRHADADRLLEKLEQREKGGARIPWLVAYPTATLGGVYPPPAPPSDLSVVASDGSSIPPDRHSALRYYVINIGYAALTYGCAPDAILGARCRLGFAEEELYFDPQGRHIPIEGPRLGTLMSLEELEGLWEAARLTSPPTVALRDGTLILWTLQNEDRGLQAHYLGRFRSTLDRFRRAGTPVASYISFTGSKDVVNALRLLLCDNPAGGCHRCPQETEEQSLCKFVGSLWDRLLFRELLHAGERSDIFRSLSAILSHYGEHRILFFYLNVGDEIVRIEAPEWVMSTPDMLNLVHSAVLDQCRRSAQYPPYPPALIEAHEQAVISTAERRAVQDIVEQAMAARGLFYVRSAKERSKRYRGV